MVNGGNGLGWQGTHRENIQPVLRSRTAEDGHSTAERRARKNTEPPMGDVGDDSPGDIAGFRTLAASRRWLRAMECAILHNLNQLAGTVQNSLPVTKTLDHFMGRVGSRAFAHLLRQHTQRLIRMKAPDDFRGQ